MQTALRNQSFFFLCILSFFFNTASNAQEPAIEKIINQPSPEVYDLLKDSKGYLWVAHDQGISRYDGSAFMSLHHPQQSSIAMTDMFEDKRGRIWCHNFSGQIFYIENLQLHLLTDYKYKEEQWFPRIVICGDELVASSSKGLFVYNLYTKDSKYYTIPRVTSSLTRVGNKVVLYSPTGWYSYESGKAVTKLSIDNPIPKANANSLQSVSYKDTFYMIANPAGIYYKMTLENNVVKVHKEVKTGVFINTISVQGENVWVNTKENSFTTDGKAFIHGMSLSDVITDEQGNRWMSSLKQGLCVQYNAPHSKKLEDSGMCAGSDVSIMYTGNNGMFWGTTNGKLYQLTQPHSIKCVTSIPKEAGTIERITSLGKEHLLLAASLGLFSYNLKTKILEQLLVHLTVKDAVFHDEKLYLALTLGIKVLTKEELNSGQYDITRKKELGGKIARCRSIAFTHDSLIAAYSDGVYILHQNRLQPLLYNQKEIYATAIRAVDGKVVIGTFTQGLFVLENGKLNNITEDEGLASSFVKNIKQMGGSTWLLYADRIQQLNQDLTGVADNPVPFSKGGITDFSVLENQLFITTSDGVYTVEMDKPAAGTIYNTFIDKITTNENSLITGNKLKHFQNYLQFHVSTPFFSSYSDIIYRYRIKNAPDSTWRRGAPGQDVFDLIVLEPGDYTFEIVATDINRKIISRPANYHFQIMPAWYQHWLFKVLTGLAIVALGLYFVWIYYRGRLRKQQRDYENQLVVQAERQRISLEIHDDIGAGLSAIRLLTEITKNKLPESEAKQEVGKIHASVSELSLKIREVIWSLNTDNDCLENLLNYIRRQAVLLFEHSPIHLKIDFPTGEIPSIGIEGDKRRHIYLSVKEALHNCLKHSGAQNCILSMHIKGSILYITVADDGRGFVLSETEQTGNGLTGMKRRMKQINGLCKIAVQESTNVQFIVPLNERA